MSPNTKTINLAYHFAQLAEGISSLDERELNDLTNLVRSVREEQSVDDALHKILLDEQSKGQTRRNKISFEQFKFDVIMTNLRNAITHSSQLDNVADAGWLIKLILASPVVFPTVRELDTFLANMTGTEHATKSTGRDRIVEWYIKYIDNLPIGEKNKIYHRIARHLFVDLSSSYKNWKNILSTMGGH